MNGLRPLRFGVDDRHRTRATSRHGVRTGTFGVNRPYSLDPAARFGGVKGSGIGRELGREGLEAYLESAAD